MQNAAFCPSNDSAKIKVLTWVGTSKAPMAYVLTLSDTSTWQNACKVAKPSKAKMDHMLF